MAASGLNPHFRSQNKFEHQHLFQLVDFAVALQGVIDNFNRDLLEFNLILRVGYNHGDITAGVSSSHSTVFIFNNANTRAYHYFQNSSLFVRR